MNDLDDNRPIGFFSVGKKTGMAVLGVLALVTVLVFISLSRFEREKMLVAKEQAARMAEQVFARAATVPLVFDDPTAIGESVKLLAGDPEVLAVEVWKANGAAVGAAVASSRRSPDVTPAMPLAVGALTIERADDHVLLRDVVRDLDAKPVGYVAVRFSLERENLAYRHLQQTILVAAAGMAALLALFLWVITRHTILAPIDRLLEGIRGVEKGEHVDVTAGAANDEVGRLATAFSKMAGVVERRERDIAQRNADMKLVLDNVGQGFLVVDDKGKMAPEHSAIVERWLGVPTAGESIGDYLGRADATMAAMLMLGIEAIADAFMPLEVILDQLPKRLTSGTRVYACDYHPIIDAETPDKVHQLVLVLSDITSEVERDRAERSQRELIAAVTQLLADRVGFLDFVTEATGLVTAIAEAGEDADRTLVMRDVHTLKGVAAIFGLQNLSALCHRLEEEATDSGLLPERASRALLRQSWEALLDKISPFTGKSKSFLELSAEEYDGLAAAVRGRAPYVQLAAMLESLSNEPVRPRLERLGEHALALGRRLGKGNLKVEVEGHLRLPHEPWSRLWPTLVHIVRNAVDHGVETSSDRVAAGKPMTACLTFAVRTNDEGGMCISVSDDGRGIDWERLREKARSVGLPAGSEDELVAALFVDGVSTRSEVTDTSGRGVGMAAVRQVVEGLGGRVRVTSVAGRGTRVALEFMRPVVAVVPTPLVLVS